MRLVGHMCASHIFSSFFLFLISAFLIGFDNMSVDQEITDLIGTAEGVDDTVASSTLELALEEVKGIFDATNESLHGICIKIEAATSKQGLLKAFRGFDRIMRIFLEVFAGQEHDQLLRPAVSSLVGESVLPGISRIVKLITGGYI